MNKVGLSSIDHYFIQNRQREDYTKGTEQATNQNNDANKLKNDELKKVVKGINDFLGPAMTHIQFEYHEKLQEYFVRVVDNETKEVVKEIPSKKMLDMYASMVEFVGLMVDHKG